MSKKQKTQTQAVQYGMTVGANQIKRFLTLNMALNRKAREQGRHGRVPFIWGPKGIGKTETVREWCIENGYEWREVPLAQFEEMGDINGFPLTQEIEEEDENGRLKKRTITIIAPPDWVPRYPTKTGGILFFDDANRDEPRIQRGLMQLYQTYEMVSWKIPSGWMIVCTGNPEDGEYDVSSMDEAQVTRLCHVCMKPDYRAWAAWAERNNVHRVGMNYVLRYPETLEKPAQRTCPRTLVEFFDALTEIGRTSEELKHKDSIGDVNLMGSASLDDETVTQFITFLNSDSHLVLEPEDILGDPKATLKHLASLWHKDLNKGCKHSDVMHVMAVRLLNYLLEGKEKKEKKLDTKQKAAFLAFLRSGLKPGGLPKDQMFMMVKMINDSHRKDLIEAWSEDKDILKVITDAVEE